jgi:hypothetical protein
MDKLLQYGKPSAVGKLAASDWLSVEKKVGALPENYKMLVSFFGFGGFGDLALFHPWTTNEYCALPSTEIEAIDFLKGQSDYFVPILAARPRILGSGPERHYLLHMNKRWFHLSWDMEKLTDLGDDLAEFIYKAYTRIIDGDESDDMPYAIWKRSEPGRPSRFFTPFRL